MYQTSQFLREHILETLSFYHPHCIDHKGGFFHSFSDDGSIENSSKRHLVSSCRFVYNYALVAKEFKKPGYLKWVKHGLDYLNHVHYSSITGGYVWEMNNRIPVDQQQYAYGHAFALIAHAMAIKAGLKEANSNLERIYTLLEEKFWEPEQQLYKDEFNNDFTQAQCYRGQNANMHLCEGMILCYEATGQQHYLGRAVTLAARITKDLAQQGQMFIWEHYNQNWEIDFEYNKSNPKHLFKPWGFQAGHQTEWTKLLLILYRYKKESWMLSRAEELFNETMSISWDHNNGGIHYGFSPELKICDADKYYWVQIETIAAAALLAITTGDEKYWHWYEKIWDYSMSHMVDHHYGAWHRILNSRNQPYDNHKSPLGKTDYHVIGACGEILKALQHSPKTST